MSLKLLRRKIDSLRHKIYLLVAIQGISKTLLVVMAVCLINFSLDYFLHIPRIGRIVIFAFCLLFIGQYLVRRLLLPLRVDLKEDDIVLALEKADPNLKDKMISAFQFAKLLDDPEYTDSREMTRQVIEEAEGTAEKVNFSGILEVGRTFWIMTLPIIAGTLIMGNYALFPQLKPLTGIWARRNLAFRNTEWPRRTHLLLLEENFVVPQNQKVRLQVKAKNPDQDIYVWYRKEKGFDLWRRKQLRLQDGIWNVELDAIAHNRYFYIEGDGHLSGMYKILPAQPQEKTQIKNISLNFPEYNIVRAKGESLYIKLVTRGKAPRSAKLYHSFASQENETRGTPLANQGKGVFTYDFRTLTEDFSFYFEGGDDDDHFPVYQVKVLSPPTTETVEFWLQQPAYTKIPPTPWDKPETQGNIKALIGTKVIIRVKTNIKVKHARVVFPGKHEKILPPIELSADPPAAQLQKKLGYLYGSFVIKRNTRYKVELTAYNHLDDPNPASFFIRAVRDQVPYIRVLNPKKRDLDMTAKGSLPLHFESNDDFGITRMEIRYRINRGKWKHIALDRSSNDKDYGAKKIASSYILEMQKLQVPENSKEKAKKKFRELRPGDNIMLKIFAQDNSSGNGPGFKESNAISIDILSDADLGKVLHEQLKEIKRQLRRISEYQERRRERIQLMVDAEGKFEIGDIASLLQHRFAQHSISRDVHTQKREVDDVLQTIENNNLWDIYTRRKIEQVARLLDKIAEPIKSGTFQGASAQAEEHLTKAYHIFRKDQTKGKSLVQDALEQQSEILKNLQQAITLLSQWEDFNEVVRDIQEILEMQRKIRPRLKKYLKK